MEKRMICGAHFVARLILGGIFLYAGGLKAGDPVAFHRDILSFRLLPDALAWTLAFYLPWLEIGAGALLILGGKVRPAALLTGGMSLLFLAAILVAWTRGLDIRCGCFGSSVEAVDYGWLVFRDVALAVGSYVIWRRETKDAPTSP